MVEGQLRDSTRMIPTFFFNTTSTIRIQTYINGNPPMSDGADRMEECEPDSGLGYTQDYRSRWTHKNFFHLDSVSQRTEQPASHEWGAGHRPAGDRIPEETDRHGDSRWDIPRKRVLFTSDGTDSTTYGSNTPESHTDRPPDVEYSEGLMTEKRQYERGAERLCSLITNSKWR